MGSVTTSDNLFDQQSSGEDGYSPSPDVSESETALSDFTARRFATGGASSSIASSPMKNLVAADVMVMACDDVAFWDGKIDKPDADFDEVEMMKERFTKLLLGEDMSGGGKGVCSALAISNAITNLSATVFGELWRLEPLAPQKKSMWSREMEWLICASDSIIELIPSVQEFPGGGTFEVMVSRPRSDLQMSLPALKKLDAMLLGVLDGFHETEFWYVDRGIMVAEPEEDGSGAYPSSSFGRPSLRQEEKWWLPCPCVPPNGLSEEVRKRLQQHRDCVNQILKAAMAINSGVLAEMEVPDAYLETLPKSGKSCLGDTIYGYITADQFSPERLLNCLDLSSEHHTLQIANRIEAAVHVWRLKEGKRHPLHSNARKLWRGQRTESLAQRAEGLLQSLRLRCPGLPQTVLDTCKIQYDKDVGQSILESYSRVLESLAFNIVARIDDLIYVDDACDFRQNVKLGKPSSRGGERVRSYAGNLSAGKDSDDARERD